MKKKTQSSKNINPNRKFKTGTELINRLDKLYRNSMLKQDSSSVKNLFFSGFKNDNLSIKSSLKIKNPKLKEIFSSERKSLDSQKMDITKKTESLEIKEEKEEEKNILELKVYEDGSQKTTNNKILNISNSEASLHSYKPEENKLPKVQKDYYSSFLDKYQFIRRERLLQSSIDFYLHQGKYKNKFINYKKEYIDLSTPKTYPPFSELKRVPDLIAFGKIVPKESIKIQKDNKKKRKYTLLRAKSTIIPSSKYKN